MTPPGALAAVRWRPFRLPMRDPFEAAHGTIEHREGVLLEVLAADGLSGVGEASPLPALGGGTADDVLRRLERNAAALVGREGDAAIAALPAAGPGAAALRCALDTALLDVEGRRNGVPVAALLAESPATSVLVNAVIGGGDTATVVARARAAVAAGYAVLKLKVGVGSLDGDVRNVEAVREACPDAALRLDANGAWDERAAAEAIAALAPLGVELLEQPVPASDVYAMARLREASSLRIAADEAVAGEDPARRVVERRAADLLVLKPMLLGGPRPALALAHRAAEAGIGSFATTTFDSSVGTAAALHLGAALPWDAAHGLGTVDHLAADVVAHPLRPVGGWLPVPAPGLGVTVDAAALDRVATAAWREVPA